MIYCVFVLHLAPLRSVYILYCVFATVNKISHETLQILINLSGNNH